jgi:hypothetical protein
MRHALARLVCNVMRLADGAAGWISRQSLETAALLCEDRISVRLLVREPSLVWNPNPNMSARSIYKRLRYPRAGLGEGLSYWMYCNMPRLFHHLPRQTRVMKATTVLGPAGAFWLKSRVIDQLPIMFGHFVSGAEVQGNHAVLQVMGIMGSSGIPVQSPASTIPRRKPKIADPP